MDMQESTGASVADVVDHGGSLTRAQQLFPHAPQPWLDLSTGINPHPYPLAPLTASAFTRLPEDSQMEQLLQAAARAYRVRSPRNIVAAPGTQILLPLVAELVSPGSAAILSPTYAEHARTAALAGHKVSEVQSIADLRDADYGILVNPNNPDGRVASLETLRNLASELRARSGLLMVDEAFMDVAPAGLSLAPEAPGLRAMVLRSFGKFYGLAGIRLGFAIGPEDLVDVIRAKLGPWAVSGPALESGIAALSDIDWQQGMRLQLEEEAARLDAALQEVGLDVTGGTSLYRYVRSKRAKTLFNVLGNSGIWVRKFDFDPEALRFGLPGNQAELDRLRRALSQWYASEGPQT
jgi:cobalamin biosynthetic protein CobC